MRNPGVVVLKLTPDEAEFLAECVENTSPRDGAIRELETLARKARMELEAPDAR